MSLVDRDPGDEDPSAFPRRLQAMMDSEREILERLAAEGGLSLGAIVSPRYPLGMTSRVTDRQRDVLETLRGGPKTARGIMAETDDTYASTIARVRRLEERELVRARPGLARMLGREASLRWELTAAGRAALAR